MSDGLADTSLLVRYLVGEPPDMATRASDIVDSQVGLRISLVVLAETAYVLQSVYRVPRPDVVNALQDLVMRRNVSLTRSDKEIVVEALELCRPSARVSFADALLWAEASSDPSRRVYTFDERFPQQGIEVIVP